MQEREGSSVSSGLFDIRSGLCLDYMLGLHLNSSLDFSLSLTLFSKHAVGFHLFRVRTFSADYSFRPIDIRAHPVASLPYAMSSCPAPASISLSIR